MAYPKEQEEFQELQEQLLEKKDLELNEKYANLRCRFLNFIRVQHPLQGNLTLLSDI
jgi:hypothetical protein